MDEQLLADLRDEYQALDDLLVGLDPFVWNEPTPAASWTVADTVRHLTTAEAFAAASVRDGVDFIDGSRAAAGATGGPGRTGGTPDLLADWRAARHATLDALAATAGNERVPWGGRLMGVRSLATARLMETWAHGLDCFAAAGREPVDTDRLRHVAWLGWRTLPYAFGVAGEEPPAPVSDLRIEIVAPSGELWTFGADSDHQCIRGDAATWCRVATRRWRRSEPPPLVTHGKLAAASARVAQAYLDA